MANPTDISLEHYLAISRAVAGELDFQKVLNRIAGAVRSKLLEYDHLDVAIVSPDDSSVHVAFETGVSTVWGRVGKSQPNEFSPIRQLLQGETKSMLTGDAWEDPRFHFEGAFDAPIFEANLHSRIHVPLYVHGKVLGSLNVSLHRKNAYDENDLVVAQNIADLISPYVYALNMGEQARASALAEGAARGREQSIRLGAQRLTEAMEAERQRLGMELHDQTLADLSAIYRRVTQLATQANPDSRALEQVSESISRCTSELRGIIENAKPGVLDLFGLTQAIEAQLDRVTQGLDRAIETFVSDTTDNALDAGPDRIRIAVFRIVQEAVTNAIKHSGCLRISVVLTQSEDQILITVANDGIEPSEGWRRSTGGVDNIRIRAALIGSEVDFHRNESGEGSRTVLAIPMGLLRETDPPLQDTQIAFQSPETQNRSSMT